MAGNDDALTADALLARYKRIRERLAGPTRPAIVRVQRPPPTPAANPPQAGATSAPDKPPPAPPAPGKTKPPPVNLRHGEPPPTLSNSYNVPNWRGARKVVLPVLIELGVTWRAIVEDDRHRPYVLARRQLYHALREAGWSYPAIGTLCLRDHSTVIYAVQMWREHLRNLEAKQKGNEND